MREVGGYEQLMKLPITAYNLIAESILKEKEKEMKEIEKARSRNKCLK